MRLNEVHEAFAKGSVKLVSGGYSGFGRWMRVASSNSTLLGESTRGLLEVAQCWVLGWSRFDRLDRLRLTWKKYNRTITIYDFEAEFDVDDASSATIGMRAKATATNRIAAATGISKAIAIAEITNNAAITAATKKTACKMITTNRKIVLENSSITAIICDIVGHDTSVATRTIYLA